MERHHLQFELFSYEPSYIRNERVTIGLAVKDESQKQLWFKFLYPDSLKMQGVLWGVEQEAYQQSVELMAYLLYHNQKLLTKADNLPEQVIVSSIRPARSDKIQSIFDHVLEIYVGQQFFTNERTIKIDLKD